LGKLDQSVPTKRKKSWTKDTLSRSRVGSLQGGEGEKGHEAQPRDRDSRKKSEGESSPGMG